MTDTPKLAPATPAATPLREANQQRVDAAAQRVRQSLYRYSDDDTFRNDVELLIEIALAPVLEIFAAAQPAATPMAATTYRCKECGMIGHFPKNPFITPEEEAELAKLEAKGVRWVQSGTDAVAMNSEAPQKLPAAAQPQRESKHMHHIWCKSLLKMDLPCDCGFPVVSGQRESEQPEQALREVLQKFSDDLDAMRSTMPRGALEAMDYFRRSLDDILERAALSPQTDSQEPR